MTRKEHTFCLERSPAVLALGIDHVGYPPIRRHEIDFWSFHLYQYRARVRLGGREYAIEPGYASLIPPGVEYEFHHPLRGVHYYGHIRPAAGDPQVQVAVMQDLGRAAHFCENQLSEATAIFPTSPAWATTKVWDVLWFLGGKPRGRGGNPLHPAVVAVRRRIETHLNNRLAVAELAAWSGISHNQLTRLFRDQVGTTVVSFIRKRRVERARHLLVFSTQPIKVIAADVGIPDLHLFNKVIRRELGCSPRDYRLRHRG